MQFLNWLLKNISSIFSVVGILLTIYFGVYYAPSWLEEIQNEKLKNAESEIQKSVKELVYSDSIFKVSEVKSLVRAKEISLGINYPFSMTDILTKTQESFMEDKFLPLNRRKSLMEEIEIVKSSLPKIINSETKKEDNKS